MNHLIFWSECSFAKLGFILGDKKKFSFPKFLMRFSIEMTDLGVSQSKVWVDTQWKMSFRSRLRYRNGSSQYSLGHTNKTGLPTSYLVVGQLELFGNKSSSRRGRGGRG